MHKYNTKQKVQKTHTSAQIQKQSKNYKRETHTEQSNLQFCASITHFSTHHLAELFSTLHPEVSYHTLSVHTFCSYLCEHVSVHVYVCLSTCVFLSVCVCVCLCVCVCVRMRSLRNAEYFGQSVWANLWRKWSPLGRCSDLPWTPPTLPPCLPCRLAHQPCEGYPASQKVTDNHPAAQPGFCETK